MSGSVKSVRMSVLFAFVATAAVVAGALIGTNVASADSVQVQSYQRASQSEACTAQPGETPWQASWGPDSSWSPSWEQWANDGSGGWVCTRSITWARTPTAASGGGGSVTYALGDIGPGGGLVFLIFGGLTYEMAPKTWGAAEATGVVWCNDTTSLLSGTFSEAVGAGEYNTALMAAPACTSGAANSATAFSGGGYTDWFLPSKDELNAMYTYQLAMPTPMVATYGFGIDVYWSSSQFSVGYVDSAWFQRFVSGAQNDGLKEFTLRVRPVRAF